MQHLPQQQAQQQTPAHTAARPPIIGVDAGGANAGTLHQNRLVLTGTRSVPSLIMASRFGVWDDFRTVTQVPQAGGGTEDQALASDGFWIDVGGSRANELHALIAQEGMLLFGQQGEVSSPADVPFQPGRVEARENSWYGSDRGRTVIITGGLVVFVQRNGEDVRGFLWSEQERKYLAPSLFQRTGKLVDGVRDLTLLASSDTRSDTAYVIEAGASGKIGVMALTENAANATGQALPAWSEWVTRGEILGATATRDGLVFAVRRGGEVAMERVGDPRTDRLDGSARWENEGEAAAVPDLPSWVGQAEGLSARTRLRLESGSWDEWGAVVPWVAGTKIEEDTEIEVGYVYPRTLQSSPFYAPSGIGPKAGARRNMRIMDVTAYLHFFAGERMGPGRDRIQVSELEHRRPSRMPIIVNGRRVYCKRSLETRRSRFQTGAGGVIGEVPVADQLESWQIGSLRGWRRVPDLTFTFEEPIRVDGVSYLAAG